MDFIFMLTRNDRTVDDAFDHLTTALDLGVQHIGFKDVGLPIADLLELNRRIQAAGATSYLEVVSLDKETEIASVSAALEIGVDVVLGGTHPEEIGPMLFGNPVRYFPFAGRISGHPSVLNGPADQIVESARHIASLPGVDGIDLLAWRFDGDVDALVEQVIEAIDKPVVVAGSIVEPDQIRLLGRSGAAAFTVGTAVLDGAFGDANSSLAEQLGFVLAVTAMENGKICPNQAFDLTTGFARFSETWSPRVAGQINDMQVKLAKFDGEFVWHKHNDEDELFLVTKGLLAMQFRDRTEYVTEGQFLIVPRGIEHCPQALNGVCEVVLLEPASTLNTGNVTNRFTIRELQNA